MATIITYKILFEVNVFHHYFLNNGSTNFKNMDADNQIKQLRQYNIHDIFEIKPSIACLETLKNHQMIYKASPMGFVIGTKLGEQPDQAARIPDKDIKFTFIINLKKHDFFNFTDLIFPPDKSNAFYFNNLNKSSNGALSLSQASAVAGLKFVDDKDLVLVRSPLINYTLNAGDTKGTAVLIDRTKIPESKTIEQKIDSSKNILKHQLDFRRAPSGFYTLKVNNDEDASLISEESFYLANDRQTQKAFAIIEIFAIRGTNTFALLNANGSFKAIDRNYELRFNNRSTTWRYHFKKDQSLSNSNADLKFEVASNKKVIITKQNQPLTASGKVSLSLGTAELPNPTIKNITPENGKVYSEIYL